MPKDDNSLTTREKLAVGFSLAAAAAAGIAIAYKSSSNDKLMRGSSRRTSRGLPSRVARDLGRTTESTGSAMEQDRNLIYHPLDPSSKQIRVLHIFPAEGGTSKTPEPSLHGFLEHVNLDSQPCQPYIALSYVWGSEPPEKTICIHENDIQVEFEVRPNLYQFLETWTCSSLLDIPSPLHRCSELPLWIDSICINQNNEEEKEPQIRLMREVYASAQKTIIWLGKAADNSDAAFDYIAYLSRFDMEYFEGLSQRKKDDLWDDRAWAGFCALHERKYFRRRWTVQEAVLSKDLYVACGEKLLSWDQWYKVMDGVGVLYQNKYSQSIPVPMTDIEPSMAIGTLRAQFSQENGGRPIQMLELLTRFRRNDSGEFHDRIYAFLGLCTEKEALMIPIDNKIPIEEIFMTVALNHVRLYHNLNFLSVCNQRARIPMLSDAPVFVDGIQMSPDNPNWAKMKELPSLPTWTPNWTSYHVQWTLGSDSVDSANDYSPIFSACGLTQAKILSINTAVEQKRLRASGVLIDNVAYTNPFTPVPPPDQRNPQSNVFPILWEFFKTTRRSNSPYGSTPNQFIAFMRTLTCGGLRTGSRFFVSDLFLRYWFAEFFRNEFGFNLRRAELLQLSDYTRPSKEECYQRPAEALQKFHLDPFPILGFEKLCHFKAFITQNGYFGLGPPRTKAGDKIAIIFGASSPIVLYPDSERPGGLSVRGEAYVHGWMFGEAIQKMMDGQLSATTFDLV